MTEAERIYNLTCRHLLNVQVAVDRLAELQANQELQILSARLQRLAFRSQPAPTPEHSAQH